MWGKKKDPLLGPGAEIPFTSIKRHTKAVPFLGSRNGVLFGAAFCVILRHFLTQFIILVKKTCTLDSQVFAYLQTHENCMLKPSHVWFRRLCQMLVRHAEQVRQAHTSLQLHAQRVLRYHAASLLPNLF